MSIGSIISQRSRIIRHKHLQVCTSVAVGYLNHWQLCDNYFPAAEFRKEQVILFQNLANAIPLRGHKLCSKTLAL